jgi:hypothetical protein
MEWIASTLHTTSEHGVSRITTADVHTSAASSRPNRRPRRFKWTRPFRRKTKSGLCACAITFQTQSTVKTVLSGTWLQKKPLFSGKRLQSPGPTLQVPVRNWKLSARQKRIYVHCCSVIGMFHCIML